MSYFIMVTSEDSQDCFPENTASKFQVKLPGTLPFATTLHEVGLVEIHTNVKRSEEFSFVLTIEGKKSTIALVTLPGKRVNLVDCLNDSLSSEARRNLSFLYNEAREQCTIRLKANTEIELNSNLADALGFEQNILTKSVNQSTAKPRYIEVKLNDVCVTCSVIKPQLVCNKFVKFLRVLPKKDFTKDICETYNYPYFVPIERDSFHVMSFVLCTPFGDEIKISGKTTLLLQFRAAS